MVDLSAQPSAQPLIRRLRAGLGKAGLALPAALVALVALSVLISGIWVIVDLNVKAAKNREGAVRALQLAESGAAHALGLLRVQLVDISLTRFLLGWDNTPYTADDGRLTGYGLTAAEEIPAAGVSFGDGMYFVELIDDPAETDGDPFTDGNSRIVASCRGVASDGASATLEVMIGVTPLPAMASDGNLTINGNPQVTGPCGGVHANNIVVVSGNPEVSQTVSASNTVEVSGSITDPAGNPVEPLQHQPPVEIPERHYAEFCPSDADFTLKADGTILDASGNPYSGPPTNWVYASSAPVIWDLSGNTVMNGTYCVEGSAKISGNPGDPGSPANLSIVASGSVEVSGNPYFQPDHPDGLQIMAEGDVSISGNPSAGTNNYAGAIYAGSQCQLNGNPRLAGQILCKDNPNPPGSVDYASEISISGNAEIIFDCSSLFTGKRRVLSWSQKLGS